MSETSGLSLFTALVVLAGTALLLGFVAWLAWGLVADRRQAKRATKVQSTISRENALLGHADTAMMAVESIRARHDALPAALRSMPLQATPEEALRVVRQHLPSTGFKALAGVLKGQWEATAHPPFLAAMAGLGFEHIDGGSIAPSLRPLLRQVFEQAPVAMLSQVSEGLRRRSSALGPWMLDGGLGDIDRACPERTDEGRAVLADLRQALAPHATAAATGFVHWSVERYEQGATDADPRDLARELVYHCAPLLGEPLQRAHDAFQRHGDDPRWRRAALSLDAMAVAAHASDAMPVFDFTGMLERLRNGLKDYDEGVADTAGHAAADIVEAGYLRDADALFMFEEVLDWSQNIHRPRPPGQQRLETLLAELKSTSDGAPQADT